MQKLMIWFRRVLFERVQQLIATESTSVCRIRRSEMANASRSDKTAAYHQSLDFTSLSLSMAKSRLRCAKPPPWTSLGMLLGKLLLSLQARECNSDLIRLFVVSTRLLQRGIGERRETFGFKAIAADVELRIAKWAHQMYHCLGTCQARPFIHH